MTRFFFNACGCADIRDDTGIELPDLVAAGQKAARMTAEILPMVEPALRLGGKFVLNVTNGNRVLLTMAVSVDVPGEGTGVDACSQDIM